MVPGLVIVARGFSLLTILPCSNDEICHLKSNLTIGIYTLVIIVSRSLIAKFHSPSLRFGRLSQSARPENLIVNSERISAWHWYLVHQCTAFKHGNEESEELGEVISPLLSHTLAPRTDLWSVMAQSII